MDKNTKNYIDEMHKDGFTDEQIKEKLKSAGWSEKQINQVLYEKEANRNASQSQPQAQSQTQPAEEKQAPEKNKILIYVITGVVSLVAIAFSFALYTGAWNPFYSSELDTAIEESEREREEIIANREANASNRLDNPYGVELPSITGTEAQDVRDFFEDEGLDLISFYDHSKTLLEVDTDDPGAPVFCEQWVEELGDVSPEFSETPRGLLMMAATIPHKDTVSEVVADIAAKHDFVSACMASDFENIKEQLQEIGATHIIAGRMLRQAGVDISIE